MKITKHIYFYQVKGDDLVSSSNTVIIVGNDKQIIIDPGTNIKNRLDDLVDEMEKDRIDINKTTEIWLTHSHPDHSQMIHDLSKKFGEQRLVRCHPLAKPILNNPNLKKNFIFQEKKEAGPYWRLLLVTEDRKKINSGTKGSILSMIKVGISILWRKVNNIEPFFDGEIVKISPIKVQVVFLPGHTPDEVGFWIPKEGVLILGDLINIFQYKDNKMSYKLVVYNFQADLDQALESLKKMRQIGEKKLKVFSRKPEILLTPHSAPVRGRERIQEIFDQLISMVDIYKAVANKFIRENPDLDELQLVTRFAKTLPDGDLLLTEKRFIALAVLKSLGVIK